MKQILLLTLLALGYQSASAQSSLQTFGSGANQFTMEFVTIGNPNNAADTTGSPNPAGSVAYTYSLGKYEVSRDMISKANLAGNLGITMADISSRGGNGVNRPATGISWYEAARYVNWLNTSTGGTAAYKFSGSTFQLWSSTDAGYNASNKFRNSNAKFWLPSTDEWYKGAYGKADGTWSNFANGSDSAPTAVVGGTAGNTAVYAQSSLTGPADITNAGGLSAYATMGQGGNAWELTETAYDGINDIAGESLEYRGGSWYDFSNKLGASTRLVNNPLNEYFDDGFRVASVPEPSAGLLVLLGLSGLLLKRRK